MQIFDIYISFFKILQTQGPENLLKGFIISHCNFFGHWIILKFLLVLKLKFFKNLCRFLGFSRLKSQGALSTVWP